VARARGRPIDKNGRVQCIETLTASGSGRWGDHHTEFALSTVRRTWGSRLSDKSRSVETFLLSFQLRDHDADRRSFATTDERDAFLDASITDRSFGGDASSLLGGCRPWIENYLGDELGGVSFVMDYLRLEFQRGFSDFHVWPQVRAGDSRLDFGDPGYRDGLCGFIAHTVTFADIFLDDGLVIGFDAGELVVSPEQVRLAPWPEVVEGDGGGLWAAQAPFE
jgi:hypothetical protein